MALLKADDLEHDSVDDQDVGCVIYSLDAGLWYQFSLVIFQSLYLLEPDHFPWVLFPRSAMRGHDLPDSSIFSVREKRKIRYSNANSNE